MFYNSEFYLSPLWWAFVLCKHSSYPVFKCFAALIAWRLACRLWVRTAYQDQALCLQPSERARVAKQSGRHVHSSHFPGIYPHKNYPQLCTAWDIQSLLHQALCDLALFQLPPHLLLPCYSSHSSPPGALNMGALPPLQCPVPQVPMSKYQLWGLLTKVVFSHHQAHCSNSCAVSGWCYLTISSSAAPFSFHLQSFLASGSFPVSQLFASDGWSMDVQCLLEFLFFIFLSPPNHPMRIGIWTILVIPTYKKDCLVCSDQLLSRVWLFATPWTAARQASLSITNSWTLLKFMSIESVMPSNHLILCRPLLLPPSIFPSFRVFSSESVLPIKWPKYWSFSFSINPSNEYSGLISFRMDWISLKSKEPLKSLLQHHSSKAPILQHSAFFIVQLSHPYMTTGKTIALIRQTFVGKVMFLLFNMLLVITFLPRSKRLLISWLQSPPAVILEPPLPLQNKVCYCFHYFPIYFPWSDGTRCHDINFLYVEF